MLTRRRLVGAILRVSAALAGAAAFTALELRAASLPDKLNDQEFWTLSEELSEPNGFFRSDNFLSNERGYQLVIPDLVSRIRPGGVYLGVGPEQNFHYIAALAPRLVFIVDIRRGNLHEQLLYKALFEMSADRADFLSRLFSRRRPAGLDRHASIVDIFAAYDGVLPNGALYADNEKAVIDWLTKKHRFPLSDEDIKGIEYIYHDAFFAGGPHLDYAFGSAGGMGRNAPTYQELMLTTDGTGLNRGFLAKEESFAAIKSLESKNLLVPVVGNFGGPKAIRAIGQYVRRHGGTVVAFYLSNVEQYLMQDNLWGTFCASVATLPLDETSTFIYSGRGGPFGFSRGFPGGGGFGQNGGGLATGIRPMLGEARRCAATPQQ
jgi:hypothetical protein